MKVLLVRPRVFSYFSAQHLIKVEPLELEYLAAVCNQEKAEYQIYDGLVAKERFETFCDHYHPDLVAFTGYINAVGTIKKLARRVKRKGDALVLVGGVHAELNAAEFFCEDIDFIVHSGGTEVFRKILQLHGEAEVRKRLAGIYYRSGNQWVYNQPEPFDPSLLPLPDRTHFNKYRHRFRYLNYRGTAIIKTSYGCPYQCDFCYCRNLNGGVYTCRDMAQVVEETAELDAQTIWIVDDLFLQDIKRVHQFADLLRQKKIDKQWIIYSRADWIVKHQEMLQLLKQIGVIEIIVGLEAINDDYLNQYQKKSDASINATCVRLLKQYGISCTGLFVIPIEARGRDFKHLVRWIVNTDLDLFTFSIFTPLPGTALYEKYRDRLFPRKDKKMDFLHLTLPPVNMSKICFYFWFYWLHIRLLFAKQGYRILKRLLNI
jgi:radical SAM superfamily enzyme YgiQ (UPF0313 family)